MELNSFIRNLGMALTVIGIILLAGYGIYNLMASILIQSSSMVLNISITAIILGIMMALLSLLIEKIKKKDREVERKY